MKKITLATLLLTLLALGGCDGGRTGAINSVAEDFARATCACDWEESDYANEAMCVSARSEGPDDCEQQAIDQVASYQGFVDCVLDGLRDLTSCTRSSECDEAALAACEETYGATLDMCPEVPEADQVRIQEITSECRSGGPGGCPNDDIGSALGEGVASGTTMGGGNDLEGSCGGGGAPDQALTWTAPSTGTFVFDTFGSDFDTLMYALTACDGEELACNDDAGDSLQSEITLSLEAGESVVIVIDAFGSDAGTYILNIRQEG